MNRFFKYSWRLSLILPLIFALPLSAQQFIDGLSDVPQMAGMNIEAHSRLIFDSASDRIVELQANVPNWTKAQNFYRETLPSLGWKEVAEMHFVRDGEHLKMSPINDRLMLINLSPRP